MYSSVVVHSQLTYQQMIMHFIISFYLNSKRSFSEFNTLELIRGCTAVEQFMLVLNVQLTIKLSIPLVFRNSRMLGGLVGFGLSLNTFTCQL